MGSSSFSRPYPSPLIPLPPPLVVGIHPITAHLLSLAFTTCYVGSLYLSQLVFIRNNKEIEKSSHASGKNGKKNKVDDDADGETVKSILFEDHTTPTVPVISSTDRDGAVLLTSPSRTPSAPIESRAFSSRSRSISPPPPPGSRDHPLTIKIRMQAVGLATIISILGVFYIVKITGNYTVVETIKPTFVLLGLPSYLASLSHLSSMFQSSFWSSLVQTSHFWQIIDGVFPYLLAPTLFLGPLLAKGLDGSLPFQYGSYHSPQAAQSGVCGWLSDTWNSFGLVETRNYVVGPLTEELVFRSTILAVSLLGGLSIRQLVFGTPMWFGIAHAHHALEVYNRGGRTRMAAIQAIGGCMFQLTYTTLFGWFAAYLYLRTGSVLPPLISHIFCNLMGIYLPTLAIRRHPSHRRLIWSAYLSGIAGFAYGVYKL